MPALSLEGEKLEWQEQVDEARESYAKGPGRGINLKTLEALEENARQEFARLDAEMEKLAMPAGAVRQLMDRRGLRANREAVGGPAAGG